jgi:hypothetical protein
MKILLAVLAWIGSIHICSAQNSVEAFNQQCDASKSLAVALFPDSTNGDSRLVLVMQQLDGALRASGSKLYSEPTKPLILTAEAANILGIAPHWSALTDEEKSAALAELSAGLLMVTRPASSTPPPRAVVSSENQPSAPPSPSEQPFNPGSMDQPIPQSVDQPVSRSLVTSPLPQGSGPTVLGFHYFLNQLILESGSLSGGKVSSAGFTPSRYHKGPFAGMTKEDAALAAQQQWEALSINDQMIYEQKAHFYGDPIAKQEELERAEAAHPSGATVQGSDGTTYNVQYH